MLARHQVSYRLTASVVTGGSEAGIDSFVCGIVGFTHLSKAGSRERIEAVTRALTHRGPAQQGVWQSADVSLGVVRRVAAPGSGEPIEDPEIGARVCFDGEIHNRAELARELGIEVPTGNSLCDGALALRAYLAWDEEAFARIRGPFAAAFWQPARKRLMLARDRMGVRPLYFARRAGNLYFGSEMKAILLHAEIPRELDLASLADYLSFNYVPGPRTLVEGIKKLPPGTWLRWDAGNVTTGVYWRLQMHPDPNVTAAGARQELDGLLQAAVKESLEGANPAAVWMGGGVECTALLKYAAATGTPLRTYSLVLPGSSARHSAYFQERARAVGAEHRDLELEEKMAPVLDELGYYSDEPNADPAAFPVWLLCKRCREETTLALTGRGADALFGGSPAHAADRHARRLRGLPAPVRKAVARLARMLPVGGEGGGRNYRLVRTLEGSLLDPLEAHFYWEGAFSREEQKSLRSGWDINVDAAPVPVPAGTPGGLNRFLWIDQTYGLPDTTLQTFDRVSMAADYTVRMPFLDARIVDFAARLPEDLKTRADQAKFLLAELVKDQGAVSLQQPRLDDFETLVHGWFRGELRELLLDTLNEQAVRDSGILEWPAVDNVVRAHLEQRANLGYHLWGLVVLFLWMRRWGISGPSRSGATPASGNI